MKDNRLPLQKGSSLKLGETNCTILEEMGRGSNVIVYKASYRDNHLADTRHTVLIKELFPFHKKGQIYRGAQGDVVVEEEAAGHFELHKKSFIRGNKAHIALEERQPGKTTANINSFAKGNTLYTILGYSGGKTLADVLADGGLKNLRDVCVCMLGILGALKIFHGNGMLHLDISPDNILLSSDGNARLIDYNSVWSMEEQIHQAELYYSVKDPYSAPEVRLQEPKSICPATDLFSVCAVFAECIQGKPLDTETLTWGKIKPFDKSIPILAEAPSTVIHKVNSIIRRGLRLFYQHRFQKIEEMQNEFEELLNRIDGVTPRLSDAKFKKPDFTRRILRYALPASILIAALWGAFAHDSLRRFAPPPPREDLSASQQAGGAVLALPARSLKIYVQSDSAMPDFIGMLKDNPLFSCDLTESPRDSQVFIRISGPLARLTYPRRGAIFYYERHENRDIPLDEEGKLFLIHDLERLAKLYQLENMRLPPPNPELLSMEYKLYAAAEREEWETLPEAKRFHVSTVSAPYYGKLTRTVSAGTRDIPLEEDEKFVILSVANRSSQPFFIYGINATPDAAIIPFLLPAGISYSTEIKPGERRDFKEILLELTEVREYVRIIAGVSPLDVGFLEELASEPEGANAERGRVIAAANLAAGQFVSQVNFFLRE